jgi:predicted ABC-type ATPase
MTTARPWFVLVAGINGAGKSTFAQDPTIIREFCGLTGRPDDIEIINPDIITRKLLQTESHLSLNDANERAANLCEERVSHLVDAGTHSFVIETVLSTNKYKTIVKRAKERGFRFLFVYVVLASVEEAMARVALRVSIGGHDVPADKIRKRWPRSFKMMPWFWQHADLAFMFFNGSTEAPILLAEKRDNWVSVLQRDLGPVELERLWPRLVRPARSRK